MAMDSYTLSSERGKMKSHVALLRMLLEDSGSRCCTSTVRDLKEISDRIKHEGLSFLTITLPKFCQDFEKSLDKSQVDRSAFVGFSKTGYLPRFLSGFTVQVFDPVSGRLADEPSIEAIRSVRQICLTYGKINYPCSDARIGAALEGFISCEKQVRASQARLSSSSFEEFGRCAWMLFGHIFARVDRDVATYQLVPKHGPGATADRLTGNGKYDQSEWTERLEEVFSYTEYLYPSWSHALGKDSTPLPITLLDPGSERPVRVVTVPKTLKSPRIIAIEPTCMQYMQQALKDNLLASLSQDDNFGEMMIGFVDQVPNQDLARQGSSDGTLATLDLSEASDRVSNQLVREMFRPWRHLHDAIDATRSRKAEVPGYGVVRLAKYASMGSALTFPVEALVFTTLVFLGIQRELNRPLTKELISKFRGKVRIYGDDIIVPVDYVQSVVTTLQDFGLVVNVNKSFWTGRFRESCGGDFYDGEDVSVVRIREDLPSQREHVRQIVSTVSLRNQLYFAGYWKTCRFLDELLERLIPFPMVLPSSAALGRHSFLGYDSTQKECKYLHKPLVKAYRDTAVIPKSHLEGYGALQKCFTLRGDEPMKEDHLERAGRPRVVSIKLGWVDPC